MTRARPRMAAAIAISALAHALVLGGFAASAHFSWPAPPIPIEIQPRRVKRPPAPVPEGPPAVASATRPRARPPGETPHPPVPPAAPAAPPATADLRPFAPEDAHLVVLLRTDKLRRSPHRRGVESLLEVFPDYAMLVAGSELSPLDDFDALLIATADPHDVTATFLAARYHDLARVRALAARPMRPGDPRVFRFPAPGLAVLTQPQAAERLSAPARTDAGAADPRVRWLDQLDRFDRVAREPGGPALVVTIADAPALIRLGAGLPTPDALALALTCDLSPAVHAKLVFAGELEAAQFEAAWPDILRRWHSSTLLLGLAPALDDLRLRRHGAELELEGHLPEAQTRLGLAFARALFPQYARPYQGGVDGGAAPR